jgi:gluconokinase
MKTKILLLMGVSGCGKSTVGALLAGSLKWPYADADSFHPEANIAKMAAGQPLDDDDREPWLRSIRAWIDARVAERRSAVVSCSCLERKYRDVLRRPDVIFVYLRGTPAQIGQRLIARQGHFFQPSMLESQFAALEEPSADERVITMPIDGTPSEIVDQIIAATGVDR